jgi:hypothetical protein
VTLKMVVGLQQQQLSVPVKAKYTYRKREN